MSSRWNCELCTEHKKRNDGSISICKYWTERLLYLHRAYPHMHDIMYVLMELLPDVRSEPIANRNPHSHPFIVRRRRIWNGSVRFKPSLYQWYCVLQRTNVLVKIVPALHFTQPWFVRLKLYCRERVHCEFSEDTLYGLWMYVMHRIWNCVRLSPGAQYTFSRPWHFSAYERSHSSLEYIYVLWCNERQNSNTHSTCCVYNVHLNARYTYT